MPDSKRYLDRLRQGPGAVYSEATAAALLPIADVEARAWLRDRGLVVHLKGRPVVCWRSVLDALNAGHFPATEHAKTEVLPRVKL